MNLKISKFNLNKNLNNFCYKNGGKNISPIIRWNKLNKIDFYALLLQDTKAPIGTVVHLYVPFIYLDKKGKIVNYVEGYNTYKTLGYFGPCAASNTGTHEYQFILYALDKSFKINKNNLNIKDANDFEKLLKEKNIKILNKEKKIFYHKT